MSNNFRDRRTLPHDASLSDYPASDAGTSAFARVDTADLVQGLVDRSGNPREAMAPRYGNGEGLCSTCGLTPDQPAQDGGHPYVPIAGRTPGVHQDVDWDRARNSPDDVGQSQADISGDPTMADAEARWRQGPNTSRQIPFQEGQGPFPFPVQGR
jgi:hypothetical protein